MLRHDSWTRDMGSAFRNIPRQDPRGGDGDLHVCPVGGMLPLDLHIPHPQLMARQLRHILDIRSYLYLRISLFPSPASGNQRGKP